MDSVYISEIMPRKGRLMDLRSEGETILTVDATLAAERGIEPYREYTVDFLRGLLDESQRRRAKAKAVSLLSYRDYSRRELTEKLSRDYGEEYAASAADDLEEIGALNDSRYAGELVRRLITQKRYGKRRIRQELRMKGIDPDTAEEALAEYEPDERGAIAELLNRKYARDLSDEKGIRRAVAALQRYGYDAQDILYVIREMRDL
jgi:Uncharacterized protein conserved in bacteria